MKNKYFLSILLWTFLIQINAQVSEKYHKIFAVNTDTPSLHEYCTNGTTSEVDQKVNIIIETALPVGTLFYYNFNGYDQLWAVTYSKATRHSDEDYTINGANLDVVNICNNPNTYKAHRLQYLGNTLTAAQNNSCGLVPYPGNGSKVDIQIAQPLLVGKVYLINTTGSINGYYYVHFAGYHDGSDEDYNINGSTIGAPIVFSDSDGDGVINSCDSCPTQAGPASNNGCPLIQGNPDLKVEKETSLAYSSCQSCSPYLDIFLNSGKRHLIAGGVGSLSFNKLQIRNIGNTTSNSALVDFYFSTNNTLEKTSDRFLKSVSIPSRTANSSYGFQTSINGWDLFSSCPECASNNGNYFIIAAVDGSNTNNEGTSGEANNILSIPITYNSSATATSLMTTTSATAQDAEAMPYTVDVYDFKGQKVLTEEVSDREGENAATLNLQKGIYVIKSIKGDRKVYIN